MARTTVEIDDPILEEVRRIKDREGKSMGRVISDLLARAISKQNSVEKPEADFRWTSRSMEARIDLNDKELLYQVLNAEANS